MNAYELDQLLGDPSILERRLAGLKIEKARAGQAEIVGHLRKAEHNLLFSDSVDNRFIDWKLVGIYYTLYHLAIALLLQKGYRSSDHDATLCLLIREYYRDLEPADFSLLNESYLDKEDMLFYARSREERRKASYSSRLLFDIKQARLSIFKTRLFLAKVKGILGPSVL
jgi:uncharacterized protein (UPF0332 family)